jgi:hypothetical protein
MDVFRADWASFKDVGGRNHDREALASPFDGDASTAFSDDDEEGSAAAGSACEQQ